MKNNVLNFIKLEKDIQKLGCLFLYKRKRKKFLKRGVFLPRSTNFLENVLK